MTFTVLIADLILIPVLWLSGPAARIQSYTYLAAANAAAYLILMAVFFIRIRKDEKRHGFALWFVLNQLIVLTALFLFKMTDLLLQHANS